MNFIKLTPAWFLFSGTLILLSFVAFGMNKADHGSWLKYGIDFSGGTLIEIQTDDKTKTLDDVKASLAPVQEKLTPTVQNAGDGVFIVKMKNISNEEHDVVLADLEQKLGKLTENRFVTIGPSVGESLKSKAAIALAIAMAAIILYIAFAFREIPKTLSSFKFGVSAILALLHDVIVTVGIFAVLGLVINVEIDILFITAILTVIGFSVHDTIVTFDRIRENVRHASPKDTFAEIAEASIQQTLTRSINTSLATLFPLVSLFFFGSADVKYFVLTLIIGIVIGTFSSICLATPILVKWQGANKANLRMD